MKKVIDGKLYNTETALELAEYWNGVGLGDFNYCLEILYKTAKGNYFLYGKGGPLTRYSVRSARTWSGGEEIIEYSRVEALEWLSQNGFPKVIEIEFPDLIEEA